MLTPPTNQLPDNICTNLTLRSSHLLPLGYCSKIVNYTCAAGNIVNITETVAAYQLQNHRTGNTYERCYRLHDGVTAPNWTLYDSTDATAGVVLTYYNGDWCFTKGRGRNREFRIAFICDNNYANIFDKEEVLVETETCIYETNIKSIWGCPQECKVVNEQLCAGNGRCDYDYTNQAARCFCYTGYYGEDCSLTQDDNISTIYKDNDAKYVGLLIIVVILLVIVLTIFFYLWLRFTNAKYMIPKSRALLSNKEDDDHHDHHHHQHENKNKNKSDKKQKKHKGELVNEDSDEENNVVV